MTVGTIQQMPQELPSWVTQALGTAQRCLTEQWGRGQWPPCQGAEVRERKMPEKARNESVCTPDRETLSMRVTKRREETRVTECPRKTE